MLMLGAPHDWRKTRLGFRMRGPADPGHICFLTRSGGGLCLKRITGEWDFRMSGVCNEDRLIRGIS